MTSVRSFLRPFKQVHFLLLLETRQTQDSGKCLSLTLERSSPVASSSLLSFANKHLCVCIFFLQKRAERQRRCTKATEKLRSQLLFLDCTEEILVITTTKVTPFCNTYYTMCTQVGTYYPLQLLIIYLRIYLSGVNGYNICNSRPNGNKVH